MERPEDEGFTDVGGDAPVEHRGEDQIRCKARVRLSTQRGITGTGRIRDISASGAFIETQVPLAAGMQLDLFILGNETAKDVVERSATIVRVASDGIGVEWNSTPPCAICSAIGCTVRCVEPVDKEHT
jgi:PilZ domain